MNTNPMNKSTQHKHTASGNSTFIAALLLLITIAVGAGYYFYSNQAPPEPEKTAEQLEAEQREHLDKMHQAALVYIEKGELLKARKLITKLLSEYDTQADTHLLLAKVYIQEDQLQQAYEEYLKALKFDDSRDPVHHMAGNLATSLNKLDRARYHYERAVTLNPASAQHRLFLANNMLAQNEYDVARIQLLEALKRDSTLSEAHSMLANIAAKESRLTAAIDQVNKALEQVEPDSKKYKAYILQKCKFLRRDNKPTDALNILMSLDPTVQTEPHFVDDIAQTFLMMGKPKRAAAVWAELFTLDPKNVHAAAQAGQCYLRANLPDQARKYLELGKRVSPSHPSLQALSDAINN